MVVVLGCFLLSIDNFKESDFFVKDIVEFFIFLDVVYYFIIVVKNLMNLVFVMDGFVFY